MSQCVLHVSATLPHLKAEKSNVTYQVDVTCLFVDSLLSYGWVVQKQWKDILRLDSIMRAFFTLDMSAVVLPKKFKASNISGLEKHREQLEEYLTIIMMLGKIKEQEGLRNWFELGNIEPHMTNINVSEILYCSGTQYLDIIEANTNKQLHNAVAQQIVKVTNINEEIKEIEQKIQNKSSQKLLTQKEKLLDALEQSEILLAALKHNLNLWEGLINPDEIQPLGFDDLAAECNVLAKHKSSEKIKKGSDSPMKSMRKQFSRRGSKSDESNEETKQQESKAAELKEDAQRVLTLAQMLRQQKSYITFKSQLERMTEEQNC